MQLKLIQSFTIKIQQYIMTVNNLLKPKAMTINKNSDRFYISRFLD